VTTDELTRLYHDLGFHLACPVCRHPGCGLIDKRLRLGVDTNTIARDHHLNVEHVRSHLRRCMPRPADRGD
jgi:hypothetical protein